MMCCWAWRDVSIFCFGVEPSLGCGGRYAQRPASDRLFLLSPNLIRVVYSTMRKPKNYLCVRARVRLRVRACVSACVRECVRA